jgi:hypothetical protein
MQRKQGFNRLIVSKGDQFKLKFSSAIDPNSDGRITIEEAQTFLKVLNVSLEEALVTEIKGFSAFLIFAGFDCFFCSK